MWLDRPDADAIATLEEMERKSGGDERERVSLVNAVRRLLETLRNLPETEPAREVREAWEQVKILAEQWCRRRQG